MTLRTAGGHVAAENIDDVSKWLRSLEGCPSIDRTVVARCSNVAHADEPGEWFFIEADRAEGLLRRRCLRCGEVRSLLDSEDRWSYPPSWSCRSCQQSIAEIVYGVHEDGGAATWVAVAVRCVNCSDIDGVTDLVVPAVAAETFAALL